MSSTDKPDEKQSRQYIHIDIHGPQSDVQKPQSDVQLLASSKIKVKLGAGGNVQKSSILKVESNPALNPPAIVTWIIDIGDLSDTTNIEFELYNRSSFHLSKDLLIGRTESKNMSDLVKGARTSIIPVSNNAQSEICTLNAYRINIKEAVGDGINATNEPRTPPARTGEFLQVVNAILSTVSEIHPIAKAVWGVLSFGLNTYKKQAETNGLVVELCTTMKSIHQEANGDGALEKQEHLTKIYNSMFEQAFECCVFINRYAKKGFFGRLFIFNASDTVTEYQKEFSKLKKDLSSALAKDTNNKANEIHRIVDEARRTVKKTDQDVDTLIMDNELNKLNPYKPLLKPKIGCLDSTHRESISFINSWIKGPAGVGRVLWCNGLAGIGKSSLAGTVFDVTEWQTTDRGAHLGAFIRYDRTEGSSDMPVACLIPTIAYSLGLRDKRIGSAIAKVIRDSLGKSVTSAKTQYEEFLCKPLKTVPELVHEGPLVIVIDGLDECSDLTGRISTGVVRHGDRLGAREVFQLLSEGFQEFPFMRLLIFSRRVELITQVFESSTTVTPLPLNESLDPIVQDIQKFIEAHPEIVAIKDPKFLKAWKKYNAAERLALKANGLYIWANIACRSLSLNSSRKALKHLLGTDTPANAVPGDLNTDMSQEIALMGLDNVYHFALDEASEGVPQNLRQHILAVLGAIMVAKTPPSLTQNDIDKLVFEDDDISTQTILQKLGSVVLVPSEGHDGFIRLIHKSFDDFLMAQTTSQGKNPWFINIEDHKRKLAQKCLSELTNFLKVWAEGSCIPSHIQNYALVGPLWHIKCFDESDVKELCVLFKDDLSTKWFKAIVQAGKNSDLLGEIIEVLHWINSLKCIDCSFHCLVYCAFQCAESTLAMSKTPGMPSTFGLPNMVFWHNILPCSHLAILNSTFSISTDSQVLFENDAGSVMSWDINDIGIQDHPGQKEFSSFFNSEEWLPALEDSNYYVLGHLVVRDSMFVDDLSVDDHKGHWEVIYNGNSSSLCTVQDLSVSVFISISDMQTSSCHHYCFKDLKQYSLLLYATGIIVIDTQAMVLMRIDINAAANKHEWKMVVDGKVLQSEYFYSWSISSLSLSSSSESSLVTYARPRRCHMWQSRLLVVSKDGSTVAHLSQSVDDNHWMLRCWDTTTGSLTHSSTLNFHQQKPLSLILSAKGATSIIATNEDDETEDEGDPVTGISDSLHIVPLDNGGAVYPVIDFKFYWSMENYGVAFFPDEQKIAYLTENVMVIRDMQAQKDVFQHHFPHNDMPDSIMITPDGKTLITLHSVHNIIRTWRIEGL